MTKLYEFQCEAGLTHYFPNALVDYLGIDATKQLKRQVVTSDNYNRGRIDSLTHMYVIYDNLYYVCFTKTTSDQTEDVIENWMKTAFVISPTFGGVMNPLNYIANIEDHMRNHNMIKSPQGKYIVVVICPLFMI